MQGNQTNSSSSRNSLPHESNQEDGEGIAVDFVIERSTNELRGPGGNYVSGYTTMVKKQEPWKNLGTIVWNGIDEMQDGGVRVPVYLRYGRYGIFVERALEGSDEVGWKPHLLFAEDYHKVFGDFSSNSKIVIGIVQDQVAAQTTTQTTDSSSRNSLPHESNQEDAEGITVDLVVENSTNKLRGPGGKYISKYTTRVKKQEPWTNVRRIVWNGFGELERRGLFLPLYLQDGRYGIFVERALEGSDEVGWKPHLLFAEDYHKVFGDFSSNSKIVIGIVEDQVAAQTTIQTTDSSSRTFPPHNSNQELGEEIAVDFVIGRSTNELRGPGGKYISKYTTMVKKQEPWKNLENIVWNGIDEIQDGGVRVPLYLRAGRYEIFVERALEGSDEVGWKPHLLFAEDYHKVFGDFSSNSKIVIGIVPDQVAAQTTTQTRECSPDHTWLGTLLSHIYNKFQTSASFESSPYQPSSPAPAEGSWSREWTPSMDEDQNEDGARGQTVVQGEGYVTMKSTGLQSNVRYRGTNSSKKEDASEED